MKSTRNRPQKWVVSDSTSTSKARGWPTYAMFMCKTTWYWFVWSRVFAGRPICLLWDRINHRAFPCFTTRAVPMMAIDIYPQLPHLTNGRLKINICVQFNLVLHVFLNFSFKIGPVQIVAWPSNIEIRRPQSTFVSFNVFLVRRESIASRNIQQS